MGEVSQNKVLYVTYKLNRIYKLLTYKLEDIYILEERYPTWLDNAVCRSCVLLNKNPRTRSMPVVGQGRFRDSQNSTESCNSSWLPTRARKDLLRKMYPLILKATNHCPMITFEAQPLRKG